MAKLQRNKILISIIIPNYNYGKYLPRVLNSIIDQIEQDIEVIIIDDGSTDESKVILNQLKNENHKNIKIFYQENSGAASARNFGIKNAKGKYALMLDSDDELMPEALRTFKCILENNNEVDVILGAAINTDEKSGDEKLKVPSHIPTNVNERLKKYLLEKKLRISHSCSIFKKEHLIECPYPTKYKTREDIPVFAYLLTKEHILTTKNPVAKIYKHSDSLRNQSIQDIVLNDFSEEVFKRLPNSFQKFKRKYEAQVYLSQFRRAVINQDNIKSLNYYYLSIKKSPKQALKFNYVIKLIKALISVLFKKTKL